MRCLFHTRAIRYSLEPRKNSRVSGRGWPRTPLLLHRLGPQLHLRHVGVFSYDRTARYRITCSRCGLLMTIECCRRVFRASCSRPLCQTFQKPVEEGANDGAGFCELSWTFSRCTGGTTLKTNEFTQVFSQPARSFKIERIIVLTFMDSIGG